MARLSTRFLLLSAAAVAAAGVAKAQTLGDSIQIYWCDASDETQQFTLNADTTIRTGNKNFCISQDTTRTTTLLATCNASDPLQQWVYNTSTSQVVGTNNLCWNLQSSQSYMFPNASVKLWSCTPNNWNDIFTLNYPSNGLIYANFTSADNNTFTNLCVQSLVPPPPPFPTGPQLYWEENEIGCFIHYNLATAAGTQGCGGGAPPPLSVWAPTALDTDLWARTCLSMGGSRMIYVAKHGCGFTTYASNVTIPTANGPVEYEYKIQNTAYPDVDVVDSFLSSAAKYGLGAGFYYSVVSNAYCNVNSGQVGPGPLAPNQVNITQDEYEQVVYGHLRELWSRQPLTESWFDGGYPVSMLANLTALFAELQPNMVAFQAERLTPNPVRWVGSESGLAPYPCWSTCDYDSYGAGDPNAPTWFPAETDFTLQNGDNWFYNPNSGVHSSSELRNMYETSVGHNTALIIDIAPFPNGTVPPEQVQAAASLGSFVSQCYKQPPVAATSGNATTLTITIPNGASAAIDRIMTRENQANGQRIRAYSISATLPNGTVVPSLFSGSSVGNKKLDILSTPLTVTSVTITVSSSVIGTPQISTFALYSCSAIAEQIDAEWESLGYPRSSNHATINAKAAEDAAQDKYTRLWNVPRAS